METQHTPILVLNWRGKGLNYLRCTCRKLGSLKSDDETVAAWATHARDVAEDNPDCPTPTSFAELLAAAIGETGEAFAPAPAAPATPAAPAAPRINGQPIVLMELGLDRHAIVRAAIAAFHAAQQEFSPVGNEQVPSVATHNAVMNAFVAAVVFGEDDVVHSHNGVLKYALAYLLGINNTTMYRAIRQMPERLQRYPVLARIIARARGLLQAQGITVRLPSEWRAHIPRN